MFYPRVKNQDHSWLFFGTIYRVSEHFRSYIHNISWIYLLSLGLDLQHCSPGLLSLGLIFPCLLTPKLTIEECLFWLHHLPDYRHPSVPHSVWNKVDTLFFFIKQPQSNSSVLIISEVIYCIFWYSWFSCIVVFGAHFSICCQLYGNPLQYFCLENHIDGGAW